MQSTNDFSGKELKNNRETGKTIFFGQQENGMFYGEIRDIYGDLHASALRNSQNEIMGWFEFHGIEVSKIKWDENNFNNGRNLLNENKEDDTSKIILDIKEEVQIGDYVFEPGDRILVLNEQNNAYEIILQQLGGNKFIAMTGAKLTHSDNGNKLIAKFKGSNKYNIVEITLNRKDLYDVRFLKMSTNYNILDEKIYNDISFDRLGELFTLETNLQISGIK